MSDPALEIVALNRRIRAEQPFLDKSYGSSEGLWRNLRHFGLSPEEVMFTSICPDGDNTFVGRFVTRSGGSYSFDFDFDDLEFSILCEEKFRAEENGCFSAGIDEAADRWFCDQ